MRGNRAFLFCGKSACSDGSELREIFLFSRQGAKAQREVLVNGLIFELQGLEELRIFIKVNKHAKRKPSGLFLLRKIRVHLREIFDFSPSRQMKSPSLAK
jgi:hypothetical protein